MLPYTVLRTRNRTSRAVLRDESVEIRLARGLGVWEEQQHIENLLRRMTKAAAKHIARTAIDPFRPLLQGENRLVLTTVTDVSFTIDIEHHDAKRTKAIRTKSGWKVCKTSGSESARFHRFLWKLATMILAEHAEQYVRAVNDETLRGNVRSVRLRFTRSRWGSCSHRGDIMLSTPLFFTSKAILRYVTIHELAHLMHQDHSARFWNTVKVHDPEYRGTLADLKRLKLPTDPRIPKTV